ncbi:MAG: S41 family peptidase [Nitrospirota bacterium]
MVGEKTKGLYIIRTIFPFKDGTALYLPTSEYFSPKGNNFRNGVLPDIVLKTRENKDAPFEFAQSLLNKINESLSYDDLREIAESMLAGVSQ